MNSVNLDEKLEQYEQTAVNVANEMNNPNLRTESSKEILENFPNVRLASENKNVVKRGSKSLFSYFLTPTILALGLAVGYSVGHVKGNQQTESKVEEFNSLKQSYERAMDKIVDKKEFREGFIRLFNIDALADFYGKQFFGEQPDKYQIEYIKERIREELQKEVKK